jgi:hypothetical protein
MPLLPQKYSFLIAAAFVAIGWVLFIVSFCLPATNVVEAAGTPPQTPIAGWDAAILSLRVISAQPIVILAEPRSLLFIVFAVVNTVMLLSPPFVLFAPKRAFWLAAVFIAAGLVALSLPKDLVGDLFIGFYAWVASFFILSAGCLLFNFFNPKQQ